MRYGEVPGVGQPVSRVAQGTMMIGTKDLEGSFRLLDAVLEQGCNAFDTAHVYGGGDCERAFGRWVKDRGVREKVVILAKGAHHNQDRRRVTPYDIAADLHDSLARMQVDYVDLYVLHRDDPSAPIGPIVEALNEQARAGLVRTFGGSNWTHERIEAANRYAVDHGLIPFAVSSPNFSLADQVREPWDECCTISGPKNGAAREYYRDTQIPLFTWSSLAGGFLSGRYTRDNLDQFTDYMGKLAITCYASEDNFRRLDRVRDLAEKRRVEVPQLALAWVLNQPLNIFALVGARTPDEFHANAQALAITLTPAELAYLDLQCETPSD